MSGTERHPAGLRTLFLTEMWERLGFYILMAILTLYMDQELGWSDTTKGSIYGAFLGLSYFSPLAGGWLGDRILGRVGTVRTGAVLMTLGYASLGCSSRTAIAPFFVGLVLVGVGAGILKANLSVLVGGLYEEQPHLRDAGYNIYYMGINIGAAVAPLVATAMAVRFGSYRISFWIASVGMILAQVFFLQGRRHFPEGAATAAQAGTAEPEMPRAESRRRLLALGGLFLVAMFFWTAFYQNGFAMTLFAQRSTRAYRWLRPETYQFFQPAFILVATPPLLALFAWLKRRDREPSTPGKILSGMLIMGGSMLVMALASRLGGNLDQPLMSPGWLIGAYGIITLAEVLISPMGLSFVSKVAPPRYRGLMMGGWFAATALGSYGSGFLGRSYGRFPHDHYYLLLAGLLGFSAFLTVLMFKRLRSFDGTEAP
ncbi:peptide MFS transporter [Geothrix sp. PMB-07]|uniref:peptide MFS transporter n=1 Tax=Geothrix sp. PMB-07 TaxID=3068640 RepID=UPI00274092A1|nr:peptide MFS transporter [Geothrix sp. PMB-07]WLT32581.1 peptide MFS transporter [Geothrix sp. PMB-07]